MYGREEIWPAPSHGVQEACLLTTARPCHGLQTTDSEIPPAAGLPGAVRSPVHAPKLSLLTPFRLLTSPAQQRRVGLGEAPTRWQRWRDRCQTWPRVRQRKEWHWRFYPPGLWGLPSGSPSWAPAGCMIRSAPRLGISRTSRAPSIKLRLISWLS